MHTCHNIYSNTYISNRVDLKPIGPIAPNWTPWWSYLLLAVQVHTTTHCMLEQLGPAPPTAGLDKPYSVYIMCKYIIKNDFNNISFLRLG